MDSLRLQQIIELIPDGRSVADIGTDHAQIPIYLALHTNCRPLIAGEKNRGPYRTALHWIQQADLEDTIDLRLGSGLTIVKPGEVQWAVIAGMGFKTIIEILEESEAAARSLEGLILQPMQGPDEMRRWLTANSYVIEDERLVKEDSKLFQIIQVRSGIAQQMDDILYEIGPVLYAKGDPHLTEHIENLIAYYAEVREQIPTEGDRARRKIAELDERMAKLKEVLQQWLKRCSVSST